MEWLEPGVQPQSLPLDGWLDRRGHEQSHLGLRPERLLIQPLNPQPQYTAGRLGLPCHHLAIYGMFAPRRPQLLQPGQLEIEK